MQWYSILEILPDDGIRVLAYDAETGWMDMVNSEDAIEYTHWATPEPPTASNNVINPTAPE
jgi:hypothetical protein